MLTETQDMQRAYYITRATVYPAVLAPLSAYGTRLQSGRILSRAMYTIKNTYPCVPSDLCYASPTA